MTEYSAFDFGNVPRGEILEEFFFVENVGDEDLVIEKMSSNCSCAVTSTDENVISPGEFAEVIVTLDTKYLKGKVEREVIIYTNDPKYSVVIINFRATVIDLYHNQGRAAKDIFYEPCASCHYERGVGLSGKKLFFAVCILCHRKETAGPSLSELEKLSKDRLKRAIERGVGGTAMPPFLDDFGGQLSKMDVITLINYIKSMKK